MQTAEKSFAFEAIQTDRIDFNDTLRLFPADMERKFSFAGFAVDVIVTRNVAGQYLPVSLITTEKTASKAVLQALVFKGYTDSEVIRQKLKHMQQVGITQAEMIRLYAHLSQNARTVFLSEFIATFSPDTQTLAAMDFFAAFQSDITPLLPETPTVSDLKLLRDINRKNGLPILRTLAKYTAFNTGKLRQTVRGLEGLFRKKIAVDDFMVLVSEACSDLELPHPDAYRRITDTFQRCLHPEISKYQERFEYAVKQLPADLRKVAGFSADFENGGFTLQAPINQIEHLQVLIAELALCQRDKRLEDVLKSVRGD